MGRKTSMEFHERKKKPPWISIESHVPNPDRIPWSSMENLPWSFMEYFPWNSVEFHVPNPDRIPWNSMEFHGIPWGYFTRVNSLNLALFTRVK